MKKEMNLRLCGIFIALLCVLVSGNSKFGIGAYEDYVGPSYYEQIPLAHNLTGDNGWILLWVRDIEVANVTLWQSYLKLAYSLNLRVAVRIDTNYTGTFSPLYHSFISQLPIPPASLGGSLYIILGNEPNECDINLWCDGDTTSNRTVYPQPIAVKVANYLVPALKNLSDIPNIKISPSPLGIVGVPYCTCNPGPQLPPTMLGTDFLSYMLEVQPTLYDYADFFNSHDYPCQTFIEGKGCIGVNVAEDLSVPGLTYYKQELKMIGKDLPVFISETGWNLVGYDQNKANWTVEAFQNIWLQDPLVFAVTPFLLTSVEYYAGFNWIAQNGTIFPVYEAMRNYRCSLGYGPC